MAKTTDEDEMKEGRKGKKKGKEELWKRGKKKKGNEGRQHTHSLSLSLFFFLSLSLSITFQQSVQARRITYKKSESVSTSGVDTTIDSKCKGRNKKHGSNVTMGE